MATPPGAYGSLPPRRVDQYYPPDGGGLPPSASPNGYFVRVIISGPNAGLFVYNGAPGLGNPPILSITNSTTDPYDNPITPSLSLSGLPLLMYSGPPGPGNLLLSLNPGADTTDEFGNPYQTGFQFHGAAGSNIEMTVIAGVPRLFFSTGAAEETAGTSGVIQAQINNPGPSEFLTLFVAGPRIGIATPGTGSASFTAAGPFTWPAPADLAGGVVTVQNTGGGGGSGSDETGNPFTSAGGGGGEYAAQTIAVTAGNTYNGTVGAGGAAGAVGANNPGGPGGATTFTGDSATVTANGGGGGAAGGGSGAGGAGGTGSTNTTHFSGGAGGANSNTGRGGGGGSSAGSASAGNPGQTGTAGGAGGAAVTGGGPGASAAASGPGVSPATGPGGGAAGANSPGVNEPGAAGFQGQVLLSWATTTEAPGSNVFIALSGENADASGQALGQLAYSTPVTNVITELLSWSNLGVQVQTMIPGDTQSYQTEEFRQTLTADIPITSATSFAQVFGDFNPGVGTYRFECVLKILPTVNNGKVVLTLSSFGAVVSNMGIEVLEFIEGSPGSLGGIAAINAFSSDFTGTALTNGIGRSIRMWGTMIVSTAGTFNLEVATSVTGDNFTIQHGGTFAEFKPVGST